MKLILLSWSFKVCIFSINYSLCLMPCSTNGATRSYIVFLILVSITSLSASWFLTSSAKELWRSSHAFWIMNSTYCLSIESLSSFLWLFINSCIPVFIPCFKFYFFPLLLSSSASSTSSGFIYLLFMIKFNI